MTEKQKYLLKLFREVDEICREMRDLFPGMMM